MATESESKFNSAAMPVEEAAKALGIAEDVLRNDMATGAPANADGTINLVHYAAWLNLEKRKLDAN